MIAVLSFLSNHCSCLVTHLTRNQSADPSSQRSWRGGSHSLIQIEAVLQERSRSLRLCLYVHQLILDLAAHDSHILSLTALNEPTIDNGFTRLSKLIPRHPGDPDKLSKVTCVQLVPFFTCVCCLQEIILKRAADLAEVFYSGMPRNTPSLPPPRSPASMAAAMSGFNAAYAATAGQHLPVTEHQRDLPAACHDTLPEDKKSLYNPNFLMFYPSPYGITTLLCLLMLPSLLLLVV